MKSVKSDGVSSAAAILGARGGKGGTGEAKRRRSEHYSKTLPAARRKARKKKNAKAL